MRVEERQQHGFLPSKQRASRTAHLHPRAGPLLPAHRHRQHMPPPAAPGGLRSGREMSQQCWSCIAWLEITRCLQHALQTMRLVC